MASIVVAGDTSGSITLAAPAIAGSNTLTLPTQTATLATLTTPSFASTIGVGGATPATTGSGITFPATQSASTDANTLDDYEEGTWTPSLTQAVGLSVSAATYQKIGNRVFLNAFISINSNSNGNDFLIAPSSLPYAMASGTSASVGAFNNEGEDLYAYAEQGNGIYIRTNTNGSKTCIALSTNFVAFQLNYTV